MEKIFFARQCLHDIDEIIIFSGKANVPQVHSKYTVEPRTD